MTERRSVAAGGCEREFVVRMDEARAFMLAPGQFARIATNGESLAASLYAFAADAQGEWLSVGNTRILLGRLQPRPGDRLYSNRRRALLVWVEDSGGGHDLLLPPGVHPGAAVDARVPVLDRLDDAFARMGADWAHVPDPLNLFLATRVNADGRIEVCPPAAPGPEHVVLRATTGLRCVVLVWSLTERCPETSGALRLVLTNDPPTPAPAAGP